MVCPKCGAENDDFSVFCSACGYTLPNLDSASEENRNIYEWTDTQNNDQPLYDAEQPMKWWKFLVYFWLIAAAIIYVLVGVNIMTGAYWGRYAYSVYATYRGLRAMDILCGICICGVGVWKILTRQSLYGFKKKGPRMLLMSYVMNVAAVVLYGTFGAAVIHISFWELVSGQSVLGFCWEIAMIVVNKIYFDKRASMFVN